MTAQKDLPEWGTATEMSATEAVMWRAERDPMLQSSGLVLELLDSTPEWDRFVDAHAWALRRIPRLRDRVVDDPTRVGPPVWAESDVDLDRHIRRVAIEDAGIADIMRVAADLHMADFDRERPLWQAILVEGLPEGRAAYLFKVHHAMADGSSVIELFDLLHSDTDERRPGKPELSVQRRSGLGPAELGARRAAGSLLGSVGTAARLARGTVIKGAGIVRDPQGAIDFASSLVRVSSQTPGAPSPLLVNRGLGRRLAILDVPLAGLRAAGKAAGGTLNDAFLGALLGGMHHYHERHGVAIGDIPIALPVSLRTEEDKSGGNRFAGARVAGPAGAMSPIERMQLVGKRVRAARFEPALDFLGMTSGLASRLPSPLLTRMMRSYTTSLDLQASNFRGLTREAYLAGARVERWYAFGPLPGSAMMATLVSHLDRCCTTLVFDDTAIPDGEELLTAMNAGFDEVLAVGARDG